LNRARPGAASVSTEPRSSQRTPSARIASAAAQSIAAAQRRPERQGLFGVLSVGFLASALLTVLGCLLDALVPFRDLAYTYVKADATQPDANTANWVRPATFDASATSAPGALPKVNGYRFGAKTQRDTNPTFGVSAAVTKDISLYAVSAAGIFPFTVARRFWRITSNTTFSPGS
jgi:hypothetical protein